MLFRRFQIGGVKLVIAHGLKSNAPGKALLIYNGHCDIFKICQN
jgi:hypothetical protein